MKGSDLIVQELERQGVEVVFEYPGGATAHILDSLRLSKIEVITMRTEQAASFAADGYARVTGKHGVCMATSGPGATNLVTGIANAYLDSVPMVFITGQVGTNELDMNDSRQMGFQQVDIVSIVKPITKYVTTIKSHEYICSHIRTAFDVSIQPRKGPVLLDIPMDIQQ